MPLKKPLVVVCGLACLGLCGVLAAQDHPNLASGFAPDRVFDFGGVENVNLYSGTLNVSIPIGQTYPVGGDLTYGLTLVYDSNVWLFRTVPDPLNNNEPTPAAFKKARNNAGFGWRVSLGDIVEKVVGDPSGVLSWFYLSQDGAEHRFYDTLHEGETNESNVFYTRDGSYIRLKFLASNVCGVGTAQIETPDGLVRCFSDHDPGPGVEDWKIDQIRDQFNNTVAITYPVNQIVLTDDHGRQHTIHTEIDSGTPVPLPRITQIDLEAFGGTTATYLFGYDDTVIDYSTKDMLTNHTTLMVSLLDELTLPDGSKYEMPSYHTTSSTGPTGGVVDASGLIRKLELPTGGTLEWTYRGYGLPAKASAQPYFVGSTGVWTRTHKKADGTTTGTWTHLGGDVLQPDGSCRRSFFADDPDAWHLGLPYSLDEPQDRGRFLSTQVWESNDGTSCTSTSGNPLRSTYVLFDKDVLPPTQSMDGENWYNSNRRLVSTHTVYHDDGGRFAESISSDFDGLGHYRFTITGGDFGAGDVKSVHTNYNPLRGTYPGTFTNIPSTSAWVTETFDLRTTSEGGVTAKELFCFDGLGFLKRQRTQLGTNTAAADVVRAFERNGDGNLRYERFYGSDQQAAPTGNPSGSDFCDASFETALAALTPEYEIEHKYNSGTRRLSQYLVPGAMPETTFFRFLDRTIDAATGLVAASEDVSDLETTFDYDAQGRLVQEQPSGAHGGSRVDYTYVNAGPGTNARVEVRRRPNGGGSPLTEEHVVFDDFGRVFQEKRKLPGGSFNVRETLYDALGRKTSVSELGLEGGPAPKTTQFLEYDAFGRPGRIRPPDGSTHDVTLAYQGVREIARTVAIETGTGETAFTTTEVFDRQGRLSTVTEPSGPGSAQVTTTYGYDVGDRLSSVSTTATVEGAPVTQTRAFTYDLRGFLSSEQHPEKGSAGNGTVLFSQYDARGNVGRRVDGGNDVSFGYDDAERLLSVAETGGAALKDFVYGTAGSEKGKLAEATRHNHLLAFPGQDLQITEVFTYAGLGGRVSKKETQRTDVGPNSMPRTLWFTQDFTWTELGDVATVTYPSCVIPTECTAGGNPSGQPGRVTTYGYDEGLLGSVSGFATSITYHPNILVSQITHANGVQDVWTLDPDGMRRPGRIQTTGVTGGSNFDTGAYAFDGAGNVTAMGSDVFSYDGVSRLVAGTTSQGQLAETSAYDAFGNRVSAMTSPVGPRSIAIDPATNRLLGIPSRPVTYDDRGNQTRWGTTFFTYDGFDQLVLQQDTGSGTDLSYVYTADDERIVTIQNAVPSEEWTLRDLDGLVLRTFDRLTGDTDWDKDTIHRQGQVLATVEATAGSPITRHAHLDHLGTVRLWTGAGGASPVHHSYTAFGEEVTPPDDQDLQYTGHERDILRSGGCSGTVNVDNQTISTGQTFSGCDVLSSDGTTVTSTDLVRFEAGDSIVLSDFSVAAGAEFVAALDGTLNSDLQDLDYMHARYCSPVTGRFLSTDPVKSSTRGLPQSWNQYSYALNNPQKFVDRGGETVESAIQQVRDFASAIRFASDATGGRVSPLEIARVVFQENRNDFNYVRGLDVSSIVGPFGAFGPGPAEFKNFGSRLAATFGFTRFSFGIVEMKVSTAAEVLGWDPTNLSGEQRNRIQNMLTNPVEALVLAALYLDYLKQQRPGASIDVILSDYTRGLSDSNQITDVASRSGSFLPRIQSALNSGDPFLKVVNCGGRYRFADQCTQGGRKR